MRPQGGGGGADFHESIIPILQTRKFYSLWVSKIICRMVELSLALASSICAGSLGLRALHQEWLRVSACAKLFNATLWKSDAPPRQGLQHGGQAPCHWQVSVMGVKHRCAG